MAVGANTYGSVGAIERLVGDVVTGRVFGAGTEPTDTDVESLLDDAANELNAALQAAGYTTPVDVDDDPIAHAYLVTANNYGAAAMTLAILPIAAYNPTISQEDQGTTRAELYHRRFAEALRRIAAGEIAATRSVGRLSRVKSGARLDDAGATKKPLFTRDRDFIGRGTRDLTE